MNTIGEYELVRLLGKGGMSEVWEAFNGRTGSRHALKLYAYGKDDPVVRNRFEQEGRMLAALNHPRVVKVTDFGTTADGRPYFVMALVLGFGGKPLSLSDVPADALDEESVGRWYDDVREALEYVHGNGIIHRDLKLQNVLVGPDGHAVLVDFGISRVFGGGEDLGTASPVETLVRLSDGKKPVMGSVGYMAPELEMGAEATRQSDWYALGVIAYRLLTGMWCDARTDLAATLSTFDPVWTRIVPKLLHANPNGRECPSYAAEKTALREAAEAEAEARFEAAEKRARFFRALFVGAAAAALAAVGAAVFAAANCGGGLPSLERLFAIPAEAGEEDSANMPSAEAFRAARVDARELSWQTLADLQAGKITRGKAREIFSELAKRAVAGDLDMFPQDYVSSGEYEALAILLEDAEGMLK